ncbi:MAG TPA: lipoprotein [Terriglobales bacterium]
MKRIIFLLLAVATLAGIVAFTAPASGHADEGGAPIFVTQIPPGSLLFRLRGRY